MPNMFALFGLRQAGFMLVVATSQACCAGEAVPAVTAASQAAALTAVVSAASAANSAASAANFVSTTVTTLAAALAPASASYDIKCAYVMPTGITGAVATIRKFWSRLTMEGTSVAPVVSASASAPSTDRPYLGGAGCLNNNLPGLTVYERTLAGGGTVLVVVGADNYDAAVKAKATASFVLFLNGVNQGEDARLVSAESDPLRTTFGMLFNVAPGKTNQALWTQLYDEHGLVTAVPMSLGVGWKGKDEPVFSQKTPPANGTQTYVSVSTWTATISALLLGLALTASFVWSLKGTDTFRVAPNPQLKSRALALRMGILAALSPNKTQKEYRVMKMTIDASNCAVVAEAISKQIQNFVFKFDDKGYDAQVEAALTAILVNKQVPAAADLDFASVALAVQKTFQPPSRLSYSLARVQSGAWMVFAALAAIYLWVVYGSFPVLAGSVLGLVAISTVTAGASTLIDANNPPTLSFSHGLIRDLMTSADGVQQAHRYQAIVVNVLLLSVGIVYLIQHLAYPTFDTSWLGMLALSGAAQAAGKQILETQK